MGRMDLIHIPYPNNLLSLLKSLYLGLVPWELNILLHYLDLLNSYLELRMVIFLSS